MAVANLAAAELDKFFLPYISDEDEYTSSDSESIKSSDSDSSGGSTASGSSSSGSSSSGGSSSGGSSSGGSSSASGSSSSSGKKASSGNNSLNNIIPAIQNRQNLFNTQGVDFEFAFKAPETISSSASNTPMILNQTTTSFTSTKISTTIMINSSDRDTLVFQDPSKFNIRLPRIYRNVTAISVAQIKMLSSFYFFNITKNNTTLPIHESSRYNSNGLLNIIYKVIRNGTYDTGSLPAELQNQLNHAPVYNSISKNDFFLQFYSTGDYSLLFNDIGSSTYNKLTGNFDLLTNKNDLVARYFDSTSSLGSILYNNNQMLVAYYYPMLKDFTIDFNTPVNTLPVNPYLKSCSSYIYQNKFEYDKIDYKINDVSGAKYLENISFFDKIVYGFSGLDDPYVNLVISDISNQNILDLYKKNNSWNNSLLNNYTVKYNNQTGLLSINATSLNTSLVNTFNKVYNSIRTNELWKVSINPSSVIDRQNTINNNNYVLTDMYNLLQNSLSSTFAVDFGTYTPGFFTNYSNQLLLRDARGKYGWISNYTGQQLISKMRDNRVNSDGKFLNLAISPDNEIFNGTDLFYPTQNGTAQYTFTNFAPSDISGYIKLNGSSEMNFGTVDISFNILPTTYARILLKTKYRQTFYFSILPPYNEELAREFYPVLNSTNTPLLFDSLGNLLLDPSDLAYNFYDISQNMLDGPDYMRTQILSSGQVYLSFAKQIKPSINNSLNAGSFSINPANPNLFFQINHGGYSIPKNIYNNVAKFSSDIYIETETLGAAVGTVLDIFWYKDRGLYMIDLINILNRTGTNNPSSYFIHQTVNADSSGCIITTDFLSFDTSYLMICTSGNLNLSLRVFALRHNPYGVYETAFGPDFNKKPISIANNKPSIQSLFPQPYNTVNLLCGYDTSGVSLNILDYNILTKSNEGLDPYTIKVNTDIGDDPIDILCSILSPSLVAPYKSTIWNPFFYSGSNNSIIRKLDKTIYYNSSSTTGNLVKEAIFTNWFRAGVTTNLYNSSIVPNNYPETTLIPLNNNFGLNEPSSPFIVCNNGAVAFKTDISFNSFLLDELSGSTDIMGIPFIPPPCKYCIPNRITIKFAYLQPTTNNIGLIGRNNVLLNTSRSNYKLNTYATNVASSGLSDWDDQYYKNRKNIILGVFKSKDILGKNKNSLLLTNSIATLRLKKISQVGTYQTDTNGTKYNKIRIPEWGTYYIYERADISGSVWNPVSGLYDISGSNTWTRLDMPVDKVTDYYSYETGVDLLSYYKDVSNNSLCFIPFFLSDISGSTQLSSNNWKVGAFDALTFTSLPYVPFTSSPVNTENNSVFYNSNQMICIQDLSGSGLCAGSDSLYLGTCGPLCWGVDSGGTIVCPNYQNGILKPTFFNVKINMTIKNELYNPLYDYSAFKTDISNCFIGSSMFLYNLSSNPESDIKDINTAWGNEKKTNFIASDINSGPNNFSYINGININSDEQYAVLIRGVLPTQAFEGILRICAKNRFDFGLLAIQNLLDEIDLLVTNNVSINADGTISNLNYVLNMGFSVSYVRCLLQFNTLFIGKNIFGLNSSNPNFLTFGGISYELTGFSDFMNKYTSLYNQINSTSSLLAAADNKAIVGLKKFIVDNYTGIIPDVYINRDRFTDPISYSIKFLSEINPSLKNNYEKWGFGWNLGFDKIDTAYSTLQVASTFIRIVDDFIYLKLNDEFKINGLDLSYKENLSITRDTVGVEAGYFGKLLLSPFGSYAQTFVQSNKALVTAIPRVDKLEFSFFDSDNKQIFNRDCEFNIVLDISEVIDAIDTSSAITRGTGGSKSVDALPLSFLNRRSIPGTT